MWKWLLNDETNPLKSMLGEESEDWKNVQEAVGLSCEPIILKVKQVVSIEKKNIN